MITLVVALRKTFADAARSPGKLAASVALDFLFIFLFGWAYGIVMVNKADEFLAEIQVRVLQATGALQDIQPTFLMDSLNADASIPALLTSFGLFLGFSALLILLVFIVFQSSSWFLCHRIAGSRVLLDSYVKSFALISSAGMILLLVLLSVSFLYAANAVFQDPGTIPETPLMVIPFFILAYIMVGLFAIPKKTKKSIMMMFVRPGWIIAGWGVSLIILWLSSVLNSRLDSIVQFIFQAGVVLPIFTLLKVFAVNLFSGLSIPVKQKQAIHQSHMPSQSNKPNNKI